MTDWSVPKLRTKVLGFLGPVWDSLGLIRTKNGPSVLNLCVITL